MRIAVIGTSGAGKSTFSIRLAAAVQAPHIELDAINWCANWRDLNSHEPETFRSLVTHAVAAERWVCDGNYSLVRDLVFERADGLVWLDPPKHRVMRQVVARSWIRALRGDELWPGTGNRETFSRWLSKDHPIRWAYDTYDDRRRRYQLMLEEPALRHLRRWRIQTRREADALIAELATSPDLSAASSA